MSRLRVFWLLLGISLIIALPWVAAKWVVDHADHMQLAVEVSGDIINPPASLDDFGWQDENGESVVIDSHWWLVADSTLIQADWMRSILYALGSDANRLKTALICHAETCDMEGVDAIFFETNAIRDSDHDLWLIDPRSRVVMAFAHAQSPKAMVKDLKRLFKASHIG